MDHLILSPRFSCSKTGRVVSTYGCCHLQSEKRLKTGQRSLSKRPKKKRSAKKGENQEENRFNEGKEGVYKKEDVTNSINSHTEVEKDEAE